MKRDHVVLQRNNSNYTSNQKILPANYVRSTTPDTNLTLPAKPVVTALLQSLHRLISRPFVIPAATFRWLTTQSQSRFLGFFPTPPSSLGRKVTGTLFGHKNGHVSLVIQNHPRSEPVMLLELAMSTSALVNEMSSGLVRIALECAKRASSTTGGSCGRSSLFQEPVWTMYCNGRKCGYAVSRTCEDLDWHVLSTVQTVSVGAGVIPEDKITIGDAAAAAVWEGELMYMRASFERVVGNRDSEAFYMMNPDGIAAGPELSIFFLRN